jgi:hypothetical protein
MCFPLVCRVEVAVVSAISSCCSRSGSVSDMCSKHAHTLSSGSGS